MTRYRVGAAAFACAVVAAALAVTGGALGGGAARGAKAAPAASVAGTLTIEGLQGASGLEVDSYSWGVESSTTVGGPGGGAGRVTFSDLVVTRKVDSVSPRLVTAAATGRHFESATLEAPIRRGVVRYTLEDVIVRGVEHSASGDSPVEKLSLIYGAVEVETGP